MTAAVATADAVIAGALAGRADWPAAADPDQILARAGYHGVAVILSARVDALATWPAALRDGLHAAAVAQTMWEMRHRAVLVALLAGLADAGVGSVLLKGSALAYGLYPAPAQRVRGDSDLLIAAADLGPARRVLTAQGFHCDKPLAEAAVPECQEIWSVDVPGGGHHEIDLHLAVFASPALAFALDARRALADARPLPRLSPHARALPLPVALMQACLHRAQHVVSPYFVQGETRYGGDRLIWLMDIDLGLRGLDAAGLAAFEQGALQAGVGPVCADALRRAAALLATPVAPALIAALASGPVGPAARYLSRRRALGRVLDDLRAIPGLAGRWHHARRRLFPPAAAMRARYPDRAQARLPALYLRRFLGLWPRRGPDRE